MIKYLAAGEKEGGARIRVIRRSSRWKNKHRQANKEDNEVLVDSSEDKENSGASGMVCTMHYCTTIHSVKVLASPYTWDLSMY